MNLAEDLRAGLQEMLVHTRIEIRDSESRLRPATQINFSRIPCLHSASRYNQTSLGRGPS